MIKNSHYQHLNIKKVVIPHFTVYLIIIICFRLIITFIRPYNIDMAGYIAWSSFLAENGPSQLYTNPSFHIVYAPFFQYFLWITGEVVKLFKLSYELHGYLIKLWSVAFEFLGAWLIIKLSEKISRTRAGMFTAAFYLINPGIFINSSIWGQFDSIPATMLFGVLILFEYKRPNLAALLFLVSVLTKPQSGLLLPVVLYLYFRDFRISFDFFKRLAVGLFSGILVYLVIILPFYNPTQKASLLPAYIDPFYWLFDLYFRSLKDYPFATANAFNFWTLLGGQIQNDTNPFLGSNYLIWGNIFLLFGLLFAFYLLIKHKASLYSITYFSYLVIFSAFLFMTKMHERYLLPAIIFAMFAAVYDRRHVIASVLLSFCVFSNHLYLYIISFKEMYWLARWDTLAIIIAGITLITYVLSIYNGYKVFISSARKHSIDKP